MLHRILVFLLLMMTSSMSYAAQMHDQKIENRRYFDLFDLEDHNFDYYGQLPATLFTEIEEKVVHVDNKVSKTKVAIAYAMLLGYLEKRYGIVAPSSQFNVSKYNVNFCHTSVLIEYRQDWSYEGYSLSLDYSDKESLEEAVATYNAIDDMAGICIPVLSLKKIIYEYAELALPRIEIVE